MGKIFWVDTETTGLSPAKNAMIQLSGIIEIDGVVAERVNYFFRPPRSAVIDPEALNVNGRTKDELDEFPPTVTSLLQLKHKLADYVNKYDKTDKFVPAGYNIQFDINFLRAAFEQTGDKYYGSWFVNAPIDVLSSVGEDIAFSCLSLPNYKLTTVCAHYGINIETAHDSRWDIDATRTLYYLIRDKLRRS